MNDKKFNIENCKECFNCFIKLRPSIIKCPKKCKTAQEFFFLCTDHAYCVCSVLNNIIDIDCRTCQQVVQNKLFCKYHNRYEEDYKVIANPCCKENDAYCKSCFIIKNIDLKKLKCSDCKKFYDDRTESKKVCTICLTREPIQNICHKHKICKQCEELMKSFTLDMFGSIFKCEDCQRWMINLLSQPKAIPRNVNDIDMGIIHQSSKTFNARTHERVSSYPSIKINKFPIESQESLLPLIRECRICHNKGPTMECQHPYCIKCFKISFISIIKNFIECLYSKNHASLTCENFQIKCVHPYCYNVYCVPFKELMKETRSILFEYQEYDNTNFLEYYSLFFEGISMTFDDCPYCNRTVGYVGDFKCFYCESNSASRTISARNFK